MDHIRQELDQLMGKDRNKPLFIRLAKRDHFDDADICKFNLLSFCPNDLFPNTKADIGPCEKRHDDYLKEQFLADPDRETYLRKYQRELLNQLEMMIGQVDQKIKRSLARAENLPQNATVTHADGIHDDHEANQEKIEALEQKINLFQDKAEQLGEEGQIEEVESLMIEVEKFKKQKADLEALTDQTFVNKDRNMKVCEVCGALQSAVDTDKRLTMHLEGKLHTGYLKIRNKVAELRKRQADRRDGRNRSRSRSPRMMRKGRDSRAEEIDEKYDDRIQFSSKRLGSGVNMPRTDMSTIKFVKMAMQQNLGYSGDSIEMGMTQLGKEWRYYKKQLDEERRKAKREAERKAGGGGDSGFRGGSSNYRGGGGSYGDRGGYRGGRNDYGDRDSFRPRR